MPTEEHDGCMPDFTWLPANQAATEDVEAVFATGGAHKCRCQALKVPGWIWRDTTQEQTGRRAAGANRLRHHRTDVWADRLRRRRGGRLGRGRAAGELPQAVEPEAAVDADGPRA